MLSKKNMLIIAGVAVGGLGLASMIAAEGGDGENIPEQIKQRAGKVLGSTGETQAVGPTIYNLPAQPDVTFPAQPAAFDWAAWLNSQLVETNDVTETQDKPVGQRGGAQDFAVAESIPMGPDVSPKKKPRMDTPFLTIVDKILSTSTGWTPEGGQAAFERGQRQEAEAAAYLAGHPTLEMRDGRIVKKTVLSSGRGSDFAIAESISYPSGRDRGGSSPLSKAEKSYQESVDTAYGPEGRAEKSYQESVEAAYGPEGSAEGRAEKSYQKSVAIAHGTKKENAIA